MSYLVISGIARTLFYLLSVGSCVQCLIFRKNVKRTLRTLSGCFFRKQAISKNNIVLNPKNKCSFLCGFLLYSQEYFETASQLFSPKQLDYWKYLFFQTICRFSLVSSFCFHKSKKVNFTVLILNYFRLRFWPTRDLCQCQEKRSLTASCLLLKHIWQRVAKFRTLRTILNFNNPETQTEAPFRIIVLLSI